MSAVGDDVDPGAPDWTCADCGSGGPFRGITYDTPGEPVEYDMECGACESLDVRESGREAASELGLKLEAVTIERDSLLSWATGLADALGEMRAAHQRADPHPPESCTNCLQAAAALALGPPEGGG